MMPDLFPLRTRWHYLWATLFRSLCLFSILALVVWPGRISLFCAALAHLFLLQCMVRIAQQVFGPNLSHIPNVNHLCLTFDDGPDPVVTPQVLALLQQAEARATFFCPAHRAAQHPELVRRLMAEGHEIANHTWRHPWFFAVPWIGNPRLELQTAQDILMRLTGFAPKFFRPVAGITPPHLHSHLEKLHLRLVTWNRSCFDTRNQTIALAWRRLGREVRPGDIVLLHDGNCGHDENGQPLVLSLLPRILARMREHRLQSVTLSTALDCSSSVRQ